MKDARGFALMSTTLLLGLVFGIAIAMVTYTMSTSQAGKYLRESLSATRIADAGVEKALFCLKATDGSECGGTYGTNYTGESDVDIGTGTFTSVVSGSGASRTVTVTGTTTTGKSSTVAVGITTTPPTDNVSFGYALQSGDGGAHLENESQIDGSIYTSGDIDCQSTNAGVTGDAYVAKSGGTITDCSIGADAHADNVLNSKVAGDAYYDIDPDGISGTTVTGLKFSGSTTPTAASMPNLDLDFWRTSAAYGGTHYGDLTATDGESIGPLKITGNLIIGGGIHITVTGPIWVEGNITTGNNAGIALDPSFGSDGTVILADDEADNSAGGQISIANGTSITGSGDSSSYMLIVSTNTSHDDTSPAIMVSNNSSGAAFYAMNGVMRLESNAAAKSLAGYRLYADQNSTVTYSSSNFVSATFANSPPGTWRLDTGTWREIK